MRGKMTTYIRVMLGIFVSTALIAAEGQVANDVPGSGAAASTDDADPLNMTREALFESIFNHPPPDIPVNTYIFLIVDGRRQGKIRMDASQDRQNFRVEGRPILAVLSQRLRPDVLERIQQKIDAAGWICRNDLDATGVTTAFEPRTFTFSVNSAPDLLATQTHYLNGELGDPFLATDAIHPAAVSGFLNFSGKAVTQGAESSGSDVPKLGLGLDGALNVGGGVAIEGSAYVQNNAESPFRRGDVRLVYDRPGSAIRYSAGDLQYPTVGYQSFVPMGGIGMSKDFSLKPYLSAYRTGDFNFYLDRPSEVKIWVNGSRVNTLQLGAGTHDVRGLAPDAGQNDVLVEIEDATGRRQVLNFSFIHEPILLTKGRSLFSYNVGLRRELIDGAYRYDASAPVLSASYLKGVTEKTTLGAYTQAEPSGTLLGIEAARAFSFGALQLDAAMSQSKDSQGGASAKLAWTRIAGARNRAKIDSQVSVEYQGAYFGATDGSSAASNDVVNCRATVQFPLGCDFIGRLGGRYTVMMDDDAVDVYDVSATVTRKWGKYINTSVTLRQDRDRDNETESEVLAWVSFHYSWGGQSASATMDSKNGLDAGWSYGNSTYANTPTASASTHIGDNIQQYEAHGGYSSSHGLFDIAHTRSESSRAGTSSTTDETALTLQSSLVFANGAFALSRPVRQNFVIAKGQKGLEDVTMMIDPDGSGGARARSGWLGPAVITDLPGYRLSGLQIEPVNPPFGATPAVTSFRLLPTYKSGFLLKLGEDPKIVAIGRLVDDQKTPIAHVTIEVRRLDDKNAEVMTTFSGRSGKFQVQDLTSGRYELQPVPATHWRSVTVEIPETGDDLYRLGDVILLPK